MRNRLTALFTFVALTAAGAGGFAQAAGSSGTTVPRQGFSVPGLVAELSLFLPMEATRGMYGGSGGRGGVQGGAQSGTAGQPGAGGQSGTGLPQGQSGQQRLAFQFTRDPKLFFSHDQIARLIPILASLREAAMPTPSRARQVQADVDAILTAPQRAEYEQFRKAVEDLRRSFSQSGAQGQGSGSAQGGFAQGAQGQTGGVPLTTLERRQRQLDAFMRIMQDRLRESSKLAGDNRASSRVGRSMTPAGSRHRAG
jgi:hypothetical protein